MGAVRQTQINSLPIALRMVLEYSSPPMLEYVPHQQAQQDYAWLCVRDALNLMGFTTHESSKLAASVLGSPRERLDKLISQKHIITELKVHMGSGKNGW